MTRTFAKTLTKTLTMIAAVATFAFMVIVVTGDQHPVHAAGPAFKGDSPNCIAVQGNKIFNTCGYAVSITFCAETNQGDTCDRGFTTNWDLGAGQSTVIHTLPNPGLSVGTVEGIACKFDPQLHSGFELASPNGFNGKKKTARCVGNHTVYSFANVPAYIDVPVYKP